MGSDGPAFARRRFLERGALAAGMVWSAPAIRSVSLLGAVGTPPPSSSTTVPTATTYTFNAVLETNTLIEVDLDLPPFGPCSISITLLVSGEPPVQNVFGGSFLLTSGDGSVIGAVTSGEVTINVPIPGGIGVHANITITGGTGLYNGATGTAVLEGVVNRPASAFVFSGSASGTFTVPA